MARLRRSSKPGWLQHMVSRGMAQRPLFENSGDFLFFQHLLKEIFGREKCAVRLHNYCLMTNHVHSMMGGKQRERSEAMKSLLQQYAQWFNLKRGRDGPLFSQRYFSRPAAFGSNFAMTVRYIDQNPVKAGLVDHPAAYPWGSAGAYLLGDLPSWLDGRVVQAHLAREIKAGLTPAQAYLARFGGEMTVEQFRDMEARIRRDCSGRKPAPWSLEQGSSVAMEWFEGRAQVADGLQLLLTRAVTTLVLDGYLAEVGAVGDSRGVAARPLKGIGTHLELARAALLVCVCRLGVVELAERTGVAAGTASKRLQRHTRKLKEDEDYRGFFVDLLRGLKEVTAWP